jgi:hypothetical protein
MAVCFMEFLDSPFRTTTCFFSVAFTCLHANATSEDKFCSDSYYISTEETEVSNSEYIMPSEVLKSCKALVSSIDLIYMSIDLLYEMFGTSFLKFFCMHMN